MTVMEYETYKSLPRFCKIKKYVYVMLLQQKDKYRYDHNIIIKKNINVRFCIRIQCILLHTYFA